MFWRKKDKWFDIRKKLPPVDEEVLFCDYYIQWIGKIVSYKTDANFFIVLSQNETFGWNWESRKSNPLFWRYLPCKPERLNPEDVQ